jgi:hypothetical protein
MVFEYTGDNCSLSSRVLRKMLPPFITWRSASHDGHFQIERVLDRKEADG